MDESVPLRTQKTFRPAWFSAPPKMEFDCRSAGAAPTLQELLEAADRLSPGQIFVVRCGYDPALLCRILANRGFNHWPEHDGRGEYAVYFLKVTW